MYVYVYVYVAVSCKLLRVYHLRFRLSQMNHYDDKKKRTNKKKNDIHKKKYSEFALKGIAAGNFFSIMLCCSI